MVRETTLEDDGVYLDKIKWLTKENGELTEAIEGFTKDIQDMNAYITKLEAQLKEKTNI